MKVTAKATLGMCTLLVIIGLTACASTGGSTGGAMSVTRNVGTSPRAEVDSKTRLIFQRHQYVLQREQLESNMYYESQWRARQPFDDEIEHGARSAESRLIVRARLRSRETDQYAVSLVVENRLQTVDGQWLTLAATPEFTAYARTIADDLADQLIQGIRVR
jgi:hypothetical protein